jgi:hypothetical protein
LNPCLLVSTNTLNQQLNIPAGLLFAMQSGWNNFRVIKDQQVPWVDEVKDVLKLSIYKLSALTPVCLKL